MTPVPVWADEARFPPGPASPGQARALVGRRLTEHDRHSLVDDVTLVVSELVTNAVVHARTAIRVRIEELPFCVKLTVFDESADLPAPRLARRVVGDSEGGRGVWLVDACSTDWGTDRVGDHGKCVWALFGVTPRS